MTTREMATQYKMAQWRQIIQEREASGTSIAAFCRVRGIQRQSHFHWQKVLSVPGGMTTVFFLTTKNMSLNLPRVSGMG